MKKKKGLLGFIKEFGTEEQCRLHLMDLKWGDGYACRKCGHDQHKKGKKWNHLRCKSCGYDESCTAHTLFHKLKFPLTKAFTIVYQLSTMKKGMATTEIARQFDIHQETAWFFKRKVQQAMLTSHKPLLGRSVEVDEFVIGGPEPGMPGRSLGKKKKVEVAVEIDYPEDDGEPRIRGADAHVLGGYSAQELSVGIEAMIDKEALVITDGNPSYRKAIGNRTHLPLLSNGGLNFVKLHWHIFNIKNWVRGIHHSVSAAHLKCYLDEYHYRFRNRNRLTAIPSMLLHQMVKTPWLPYDIAKAN